MNEEKMIKIVQDRVNEIVKTPEIQQFILDEFDYSEEVQNWLIRSAIATLLIPMEARR